MTEAEEPVPIPLWLALVIGLFFAVVLCVTVAGAYDKGYRHGRRYEQQKAVQCGAAVEHDDGSISYRHRW